jgi:hypothetical protein
MAIVIKEEHNLTNWLSSLTRETGVLRIVMFVEVAVALLLLIAGIIILFMRGSKAVLIFAAVAIFLAASHWVKLFENYKTARNVNAGRKGEIRISDAFERGLDDNNYLINDVDLRFGRIKSQIDHMIVGPRGIFVVETKSWAGHLAGNETDYTWIQTKFDKKGKQVRLELKSPILQNLRHLKTAESLLKASNIDWPDIFSVIVLTRRNTEFDVDSVTPVLRPADAVDFAARMQPSRIYTGTEIANAVEVFMPGCRIDKHYKGVEEL